MKQQAVKNVVMGAIIVGCLSVAAFNTISWNQQRGQAVEPGLPQQADPGRPQSAHGGFDLSHAIIPIEEIHSGGPRKDGIPALTDPAVLAAEKVEYLKDEDLVIGVAHGEQARAYPLLILDRHEIVNDVVGGLPMAITYCPLCRSALVFDRNAGGQLREFGVSGMLWNSNVLMYDRQKDPQQESLWSQVLSQAVTGPAAQEQIELKLVPSELMSWARWRQLYPQTEVLSLETGYGRPYLEKAYASYFRNDSLMFPVKGHGKRPERFRNKEPMVMVGVADQWKAYALRDIAVATVERQRKYLEDSLGEAVLCLTLGPQRNTVQVEVMGEEAVPAKTAYLYWFSLNAIRPDVEIYEPPVEAAVRVHANEPALTIDEG